MNAAAVRPHSHSRSHSRPFAVAAARAPRPPPLRPIRATPVQQFLLDQSAIIGQGIVYFTIFYTTANWWYYRRAREDAEKREREKDKKDRK